MKMPLLRDSEPGDGMLRLAESNATGKGILIGMLAAFAVGACLLLLYGLYYVLRHRLWPLRGRILLDRLIGSPGEYADEADFAVLEQDCFEHMDEGDRAEYLRAKSEWLGSFRVFL